MYRNRRHRIKSVTLGGIEITLWRVLPDPAHEFSEYCVQEQRGAARAVLFYRPTLHEAELEFAARSALALMHRQPGPLWAPSVATPVPSLIGRLERRSEPRFEMTDSTIVVRRPGGGLAGVAQVRNVSGKGLSIAVHPGYPRVIELLHLAAADRSAIEVSSAGSMHFRAASVRWSLATTLEDAGIWCGLQVYGESPALTPPAAEASDPPSRRGRGARRPRARAADAGSARGRCTSSSGDTP